MSMKYDEMCIIIGLYVAVLYRILNLSAEFLICQHVSDGSL